jgi:hypothetical protein
LSSNVVVNLVGGSSSSVAEQAASRYQPLLQAAGTNGGVVTVVSVALESSDEKLNRGTNYAYNVSYSAGINSYSGNSTTAANSIHISAASAFGVAYALETLLQLAEDR